MLSLAEWIAPNYKSTKEKQIVDGQLVTCETLFKVGNLVLTSVSAYPKEHCSSFLGLP